MNRWICGVANKPNHRANHSLGGECWINGEHKNRARSWLPTSCKLNNILTLFFLTSLCLPLSWYSRLGYYESPLMRTSKIHGQLQQHVLSPGFVWETTDVVSGQTCGDSAVLLFNRRSHISQYLFHLTNSVVDELCFMGHRNNLKKLGVFTQM